MKKNLHSSIRESHIARLSQPRRAFSLLELVIVLAVATILAGMLLPAMNKLRENVHRVICSSNLRQLGMATTMYTGDHNEMLPRSAKLVDPVNGPWQPQELMAANQGGTIGWDGLGHLFALQYCGAAECFYCPSHLGDHPATRYADRWDAPDGEPIYMNYHYAGHRHWHGDGRTRLLTNVDRIIIATDGLRTASDFNHQSGMNVLYGDSSVRWSESGPAIVPLLPEGEIAGTVQAQQYNSIWDAIQGLGHLP